MACFYSAPLAWFCSAVDTALDADDVLMVTSTDRLARNTRDLLNILYAVKEAGAGFRSINEPMVDTTSQFAEVIIAVLGIAAGWERL